MKDTEIYLLLKTVKQNKSLNLLLREGLTYRDIGDFTEIAVKEKLLYLADEGIRLTEFGETKLTGLEQVFKKRNKEDWIKPDFKNRVAKIDKDDIFLPSQDELSW